MPPIKVRTIKPVSSLDGLREHTRDGCCCGCDMFVMAVAVAGHGSGRYQLSGTNVRVVEGEA
eukprot:2144999-Prymnesium_polylepis.2